MPKVTFYLKLTVDDQTFEFAHSEQQSKEEMLGAERPQLLFKQFCERLVKREHQRLLEEELQQLDVDEMVSEMFTKDLPAQRD